MKRTTYILQSLALLALLSLGSCKKYLDVVPKGRKIPTTLIDYEALIRDEYTNQRITTRQALLLMNDIFETPSNLNYYPLYRANYNWDESADRLQLNNSDEDAYYNGYAAISTYNLIIEHAPEATEATDEEKNILVAQAKVARSMRYFVLANYYADTYDKATAGSKLSVPLIESADIDAPYEQVTIQALYDYMIRNIEEALPSLPQAGATVLHANKGAAYALLARIYLQMEEYEKALDAAELALNENDELFDWPAFYATYKDQIEEPGLYPSIPSPMGYSYVENYIFVHGASIQNTTENGVRVDRAAEFEDGDAKFLTRWKLRTLPTGTYHVSINRGHFNKGGITTAEVYLIKAECLARLNDIDGAMNALNAVRKKRILPEKYSDATASSVEEAVKAVVDTKRDEMIMTLVNFADARRLNKDPKYAVTLTKEENGSALSLPPGSHMWTMPFPLGAIKNPGNGTITQNVNK